MKTLEIIPSRNVKLERGTLEAGKRYIAHDHGPHISLAVYTQHGGYMGLLDRNHIE